MSPSYSRTAETPLPPCFPETPTPPEDEDDRSWQRLISTADDELAWCPNEVPPGRLGTDEAIQLEKRGITSHPPQDPHFHQHAPKQLEIWRRQTIHKETIAAKLREAGRQDLASSLEDCHSYYTFCVCGDCGTVRKFPNRCDQFFCPECQPTLAREREQQVKWWTELIEQPKHVVLTMKNISDLQPGHVDELRANLTKLRRRKFCSNWRGGFYSMEVTNEGNGWHLHLHVLVDAKWIDSAQLALEWDSCTRGFGRIVKVKDVRQWDYLHEVTKYAVKGPQLAAWSPETIATFIAAFQGKRTFGVFGALYAARTEFAEFIASIRTAKPRCNCGSCNVSYYSEAAFIELDLRPTVPSKPKPPTPDFAQDPLIALTQHWPD